jgi:capsular polysaccharide biosynthesis protein
MIVDQALLMTPIGHVNKLKLFINRKESSGRTIANFTDLEPILLKLNFTILYLEDITVAEQIEFFSKAKIIVGIHGAGLTNSIFSYKNNPKILEITASDFMPTHYYWLAQSFTFSYNLFLGGKTQLSKSQIKFDVDIMRLANILATF